MDKQKKKSGPESLPRYPFKHSGTVLVLGNAFCLHDDYQRARRLFPDAPVIAVNGAANYTQAFALFTQHPAKFPKWIRAQQRFHDEFTCHSAGTAKDKTAFGKLREYKPFVDYWWKYGAGGATSGWGARRVASYMGFDLVVLCGMPLDPGCYNGNQPSRAMVKTEVIDHYRKELLADVDFHDNVKSMSGWTRSVFGEPS